MMSMLSVILEIVEVCYNLHILLLLTHSRLGIRRDTTLEEVPLPLQTNHLHEIEGIARVVNLLDTQLLG